MGDVQLGADDNDSERFILVQHNYVRRNVTVNDQIAIRLLGHCDNHDGYLLSRGGQRRQQLLLPLRIPHSQKFITALQRMKLELHPCLSSARAILRIKLPGIGSVVVLFLSRRCTWGPTSQAGLGADMSEEQSLVNRILKLIAICALAITLFAGALWAILLLTNLRTSPAIPWSVPLMALLLWAFWSYLSGSGIFQLQTRKQWSTKRRGDFEDRLG
jgi:hypothetical protein